MEHEARARPPQSGGRSAHRAHDPSVRLHLSRGEHRTRTRITRRERAAGRHAGRVLRPAPHRNDQNQPEDRSGGERRRYGAPRPRQGQQGADASRAGKARFGIAETHRRMAVPRRRTGTLRRRLRGEEDQDGNRIPVAQPAPQVRHMRLLQERLQHRACQPYAGARQHRHHHALHRPRAGRNAQRRGIHHPHGHETDHAHEPGRRNSRQRRHLFP